MEFPGVGMVLKTWLERWTERKLQVQPIFSHCEALLFFCKKFRALTFSLPTRGEYGNMPLSYLPSCHGQTHTALLQQNLLRALVHQEGQRDTAGEEIYLTALLGAWPGMHQRLARAWSLQLLPKSPKRLTCSMMCALLFKPQDCFLFFLNRKDTASNRDLAACCWWKQCCLL